jgi:hypothetical protein
MQAPQMRSLTFGYTAAVIAALACPTATPASAGGYKVFDPPGSVDTRPTAINSHDEVAGRFGSQDGDTISYQGFVRAKNGTIATFDIERSAFIFPAGLNDAGWIVGYFRRKNGTFVGFTRQPSGRITKSTRIPLAINRHNTICGYDGNNGFVLTADGTLVLFAPDGVQTQAYSINDAGTVTGTAGTQGFVRTRDGTITTFAAPGADETDPVGINVHGVVAGTYRNSDGTTHGFIRDASGNVSSFEFLRGDESGVITGIDRKGNVVGWAVHGRQAAIYHSVLRKSNGQLIRFDPPGAKGTSSAFAMNKIGDVAGGFGDPGNGYHGYLVRFRKVR